MQKNVIGNFADRVRILTPDDGKRIAIALPTVGARSPLSPQTC